MVETLPRKQGQIEKQVRRKKSYSNKLESSSSMWLANKNNTELEWVSSEDGEKLVML